MRPWISENSVDRTTDVSGRGIKTICRCSSDKGFASIFPKVQRIG